MVSCVCYVKLRGAQSNDPRGIVELLPGGHGIIDSDVLVAFATRKGSKDRSKNEADYCTIDDALLFHAFFFSFL
jgi:hypothetical protein